jgi:hypothetical protein
MIRSHETPKTVQNIAQNVQTLTLYLSACLLTQPSPCHETCLLEKPLSQLSDLSEVILLAAYIKGWLLGTVKLQTQITIKTRTEDVIPFVSLGVSDTTTH